MFQIQTLKMEDGMEKHHAGHVFKDWLSIGCSTVELCNVAGLPVSKKYSEYVMNYIFYLFF